MAPRLQQLHIPRCLPKRRSCHLWERCGCGDGVSKGLPHQSKSSSARDSKDAAHCSRVTFTILAISAAALRFRARKLGKISLELDDWLAGTAMASTFAVNLLELLGVSRGQGQHAFMVAREVQDSSQKSTLITLWLMLFALLSLKGSILALYYRIFGSLSPSNGPNGPSSSPLQLS